MADYYDDLIAWLRANENEEGAQAVEQLLGDLYEVKEELANYQYKAQNHESPEQQRRKRIAIQTYYDRRLIKK